MAERAQVTSLDALDSFRASLITFMAKARSASAEAGEQVQQTRSWLQNDRRIHWEDQCRRRRRVLEEAQQEYFNAKLSRLQTATAAQAQAVERAREAVREAEDKRDLIKRWSREFENRAEPLVKQIEQMETFVTTDLVKATAYLANIVKTLEAYAAVAPDSSGAVSPVPPQPESVSTGVPSAETAPGPEPI